MATNTTTNIHGVKAIRVRPTVFSDFVSHEVTFELLDGGEVTVSGFAPTMVSIDFQTARVAKEGELAATPHEEVPALEFTADEGQPF